MRTAAEVGEPSLRVCRNRAILEVLVDVLALVGLAIGGKLLQRIGLGNLATHHGFVLAGQLQHLCFNLGEVALLDHLTVLQQHIIEESIVYGRSESELNAGIEFLQSLGQQVSGGVPECVLTLIVIELVESDGGIGLDGAVEFYCLTIDGARYNVACESRRDALGDLETSHALLIRTNRTVWESDFYHIQNSVFNYNRVQR